MLPRFAYLKEVKKFLRFLFTKRQLKLESKLNISVIKVYLIKSKCADSLLLSRSTADLLLSVYFHVFVTSVFSLTVLSQVKKKDKLILKLLKHSGKLTLLTIMSCK